MNRTRFQTGCLAGVLALLLVACGGSGSTGLITAESALLAAVSGGGHERDPVTEFESLEFRTEMVRALSGVRRDSKECLERVPRGLWAVERDGRLAGPG